MIIYQEQWLNGFVSQLISEAPHAVGIIVVSSSPADSESGTQFATLGLREKLFSGIQTWQWKITFFRCCSH